eukprot:563634-Pleurochrysis_carterae.AAC.1
MASGIRCGAGCAAVEATMRECRWSISGYGGQSAQTGGSGVNPVVHPFSGFGRRHDPDMMMCA